jgi:hypothetical protein
LRSYFKLSEQVKFGKYRSASGVDYICEVAAQAEGHGLQMQVRVSPMADEEVYETSLEVAQMMAKKTVAGLGEHAHWNHAPASASGMRTSVLLIHQRGFALGFVLTYAGPLAEGEVEKATEKLATDFMRSL